MGAPEVGLVPKMGVPENDGVAHASGGCEVTMEEVPCGEGPHGEVKGWVVVVATMIANRVVVVVAMEAASLQQVCIR